MSSEVGSKDKGADLFAEMMMAQAQGAMALFGQFLPHAESSGASGAEEAAHWASLAVRLQTMWAEFQMEQLAKAAATPPRFMDPHQWIASSESVLRQLPLASPEVQHRLWSEGLALTNAVLAQFGIGSAATSEAAPATAPEPILPRQDRRFEDAAWREQPYFALIHQMYLLISEQMLAMAESAEGLDPPKKRQLVFATKALIDAMSPANFPLTNPVALEKARETRGESLVKGMENLLADLRRGQLTHSSPSAFTLGENIAATPGKVVYETPLFQLIQYTPTTEKVLAVPLLIFPPWINRFYILDLAPKKSFVRWAVEQGLTVFMVSWKSADATMAELVWDDYIQAQLDAIEHVRARLKVPAVHTVGYCVAGTTLAATLAVLAAKGESDKVKSATFFTAQVDFEEAGELKNFIDDRQIEAIGQLAADGVVDGRYLAAAFNALRGNDLIWSYVERNYLKGEDHPSFDLLHWNGDVTNLPARWHCDYLRDLYRDNRLVTAGSLKACDVPIDLKRITTPCYIQAGREDHIAPPESVWKLTRHLAGPWTFVLAGSGHIAGVVNPPAAGKYQFWTNSGEPDSLAEFIVGAQEHAGSWWPHWRKWLETVDPVLVPARGKRRPGGRGDTVIEDAPGRYVATR
ncbi:PHA/PHB synthase family protein [Novosphingobium sp. M1R2S20]|uniref:PHA/PHB synthase family protein n=1 Tax=Novosphingobium rhizovicinum TaxID=3228928 RepID=A0ABV3RA29_9SPHN